MNFLFDYWPIIGLIIVIIVVAVASVKEAISELFARKCDYCERISEETQE